MEKEPQVIRVAVNTPLFVLQQAAAIDAVFQKTLSEFLGSGGTIDGLFGKALRVNAQTILNHASKALISK